MMKVDDVGVLVPDRRMIVGMTMEPRYRLIVVVVVLVVSVKMLVLERIMDMLQLDGLFRWPQDKGASSRCQRHDCQHQKGHGQSERCPDPPGQRVRDEPADMRQRELRGIDCRPVALMCRPPEQPSRRGLNQR